MAQFIMLMQRQKHPYLSKQSNQTTHQYLWNKTSYSAKVNGKTQIIVDKPKTKKFNRVIPLPNTLVKLLKIIKKESNSKYVITTRNLRMVGNRSYQRTFKFILKKVNVPYETSIH